MLTNNWIFIALIGTLISSFGVVLMKYIDNSKYDNNLFMLLSFIITGIISLIYLLSNIEYQKKIYDNCDNILLSYALAFSLVIIIGNIIMQYAFSISPNISYTHIIINLNIIFTIIASYMIFNQYINLKCFIGILLSLIGIFIIAFNYEN
jgi:drug/metabolite transporter (DMT)-like permease